MCRSNHRTKPINEFSDQAQGKENSHRMKPKTPGTPIIFRLQRVLTRQVEHRCSSADVATSPSSWRIRLYSTDAPLYSPDRLEFLIDFKLPGAHRFAQLLDAPAVSGVPHLHFRSGLRSRRALHRLRLLVCVQVTYYASPCETRILPSIAS